MRRALEGFIMLCVLAVATAAIVALLSVTWLVQVVVGIANDPNAGPYRQVR